jgi:hypothetical protein
MSETTTIRASMLSGYVDCPRRAAAKQWRREIEASGFQLGEQQPSVGAAVGTAVHSAAAHMLQGKIKNGILGSVQDGLEIAIKEFRAEVEPGAVWDNTTPNRSTAEFQIKRLTLSYQQGVAGTIDPAAVEQAWRCDAGDGFSLSGHCDVITKQGVIRDLKTGALPRPHQAQLGGYSLLARSQNLPVHITGVGVDFIRRTPKTKPQDPPASELYDLAVAEKTAWATIQYIKSNMKQFRETSDPWAFMANPISMMCTPAYCPAHGTNFCDLGRNH